MSNNRYPQKKPRAPVEPIGVDEDGEPVYEITDEDEAACNETFDNPLPPEDGSIIAHSPSLLFALPDGCTDCLTITFPLSISLRNQVKRVLRPGGQLLILNDSVTPGDAPKPRKATLRRCRVCKVRRPNYDFRVTTARIVETCRECEDELQREKLTGLNVNKVK